ncbi:MAG TPA: ABC transporter ATP-binding protein/permease [Firmicutes bacterium]|nr:ABC transporter ATP-binding protein/permease [Bacillota bacterium]
MKKVLTYLKSYAVWIVVCVALLFGQAMCDLSLPNLMSNIVNVGIMQSGIEDSAPKAISENGMKLMKTFMSDSDRRLVEGHYTLVAAGDPDYTEDYPESANTNIYVLRENVPEMGGAFGRAAMTFLNFMRQSAAQDGQQAETPDDSSSLTEGLEDIDFAPLYAMQPQLDQMPDEAFASARETAAAMDESTLDQVGTVMVRQFYSELGVNTDAMRSRYIWITGLQMLALTLAGALATILVGLLAARIGAGIARSLRHDVFSRVESFANAEFDRFSTASLITRTTNDVTQVQMLFTMGIRMICYAPIMGIGGIVMAVGKSVSMTWIIALGVVILIGLVLVIFAVAMPKFKMVQKLVDKLNLVTRESLSGMMVIRAFGTQQFEEDRFERANGDLTKVNLFVNRVMAFMMPAMMFMMNVINLVIMWVGAHQIEASTMQVGDMMAFMQYAMQIIMSFLMIAMMFIIVPRAAVSADRIAEVLATEPSVKDPEHPQTLGGRAKGRVEFRHVSFRYGNAEDDVLHDISFTAEPGQTTAFIGSTGSGKSTLVNLIPRFYDVTEGEILIDGVNVKDLTQHELHEIIGYVPQKGVLFSGDIASNLRYGRPEASDEELEKAAEIAQASDFIAATEGGMHNEIAQGGGNVSGGQKQRLSIARALVKQSPIYIFDDSFSALDFKTDAALRRALKENTGGSTVLLVAQRVSTIMNAEQIVVLDEGRIVGVGTHGELLKTCETYREIAQSQLTKEELE